LTVYKSLKLKRKKNQKNIFFWFCINLWMCKECDKLKSL
jgi:hypothetical protein